MQSEPLENQLRALSDAIKEGKIRRIGLSNETSWGLMKCLSAAAQNPELPRVVSLQNAYNLLCRTFDAALAECCHEEGVALLAYSPLAMGLLTGKYLSPDGGPTEARLNRYPRYTEAQSRYGPKPNVRAAVEAYAALAARHGLTPLHLAIRFVNHHPLVASTILGARTIEQLEDLFDATEEPALDADILASLNDIHQKFPNPTP